MQQRRRRSTLTVGPATYSLKAPGFKKIRRGPGKPVDLYWQASDAAIEAGYLPKMVPIAVDLEAPETAVALIESRCAELQTEMNAWLDGQRDDRLRLAPKWDGTIGSLIDCFRSDEDSAFQEVQDDTADGYDVWFKMIRETVGKRVLKFVVPKDFRRWYREWQKRSAGKGGDGTRTAYGGIQGVRMLLNYGIECRFRVCKDLREDMDMIRFRRGAAREETLSYGEVKAIIECALADGNKSLALSQALQYETFLRQTDVIGKWSKVEPTYVAQPGEIVLRGKVWRGLTMDMISLGKDLRIRTSKTGQAVIHRVGSCELVVLVLGHYTPDGWKGPVACRADGTPFPDRQSYAKAWRSVAERVGVGRKKQNRDSRASGISEAAEAGVSDDVIQQQSGHAGKQILRKAYKRLGGDASQRSHEARREYRQKKTQSEAAEENAT